MSAVKILKKRNLSFNKVNRIIKQIQIKMGIFDKSTIVTDYLERCVNKKDDDWDLIIATCDAVNASDGGAKEAAKFIRKKISKSTNVQHRILTILKAMVENCGTKFHAEIASRKFLDEIELVSNSSNTDTTIKQKIITLLGTLAEMFQNEPSMYQIRSLYSRLTGGAQIQTQKSVQHQIQDNDVTTKAKVAETIEISKNNLQLFTQTLSFTDPEKEDITKNELIQEFYKKCKSLHQSVMSYLSEIQDEEWIETLISINQEFLSSFKMYEDMIERGQVKIATQESKKQPIRGSHFDSDPEGAGVGGSSSTSYDPFADANEIEIDSVVSGPSAKALGKMPASRFYDSTPNHSTSNNNNSSSHNEQTSSIRNERKVPSSIYNDPTLFEGSELSSENQKEYSNITAPLEPTHPNSNNINGRQEHIVI